MPSNAARVLRAAAERIERDGWSQHKSGIGPAPGQCCMMVALQRECDRLSVNAWNVARTALERRVRPPGGLLSVWNDAPGRTVDEVLEALRGAASDVEANDAG